MSEVSSLSSPIAAAPYDASKPTIPPRSSSKDLQIPLTKEEQLRFGATLSSRTLYVVMSGMNDPTNRAAKAISSRLVENGVPQDQILIPSNPCLEFRKNIGKNLLDYSISPNNPNIRGFAQNLDLYFDFTMPLSSESTRSFHEIARMLTLAKFDRKAGDRIVFIGHSLGGQRAVTMAELAEGSNLPVYNVVTLGTPLHHNGTQRTPITHIVSDGDAILGAVSSLPAFSLSRSTEARVLKTPESVRHAGYFTDPKVFDDKVVGALLNPRGSSDSWSDLDALKLEAKKGALASLRVADEILDSIRQRAREIGKVGYPLHLKTSLLAVSFR